MYFEGQGRLLVATAKDGVPGPFRWVGDCNQLQISLDVDNEEVFESYSGNKLLALRLAGQKTTNVQFTLREWTADNLALGFYGKNATIASDSVTGETLPDELAEGDEVRLKYPQVSNVEVKDSDGSPTTLTAGTDYEVNATYGGLKIIGDLAAYTQPLVVDYDYQGGQNVAMFNQSAPERWLRFEGLNRADTQAPVLVELYKVQADPVGQADLISDEVSDLQIAGGALYDPTKVDDDDLGPFGRIIHIAEPA